jgi:hypothetical protein
VLHTYTFVSWVGGFTAITQHKGDTIQRALQDWVNTFTFQLFQEHGLTKEQIATLKHDVLEARPIPCDSFVSMWFVWSNLGKTEPILDGVFRIEIIDTRLP